MRYPIIIHPDERLNKKAEPIEYITDEIVNLLDDMYETMVLGLQHHKLVRICDLQW